MPCWTPLISTCTFSEMLAARRRPDESRNGSGSPRNQPRRRANRVSKVHMDINQSHEGDPRSAAGASRPPGCSRRQASERSCGRRTACRVRLGTPAPPSASSDDCRNPSRLGVEPPGSPRRSADRGGASGKTLPRTVARWSRLRRAPRGELDGPRRGLAGRDDRGERDPAALADLTKGRMRRKIPELAQALEGQSRPGRAAPRPDPTPDAGRTVEACRRLVEEQQLGAPMMPNARSRRRRWPPDKVPTATKPRANAAPTRPPSSTQAGAGVAARRLSTPR